jgi:hypothetical protein
MIALYVDDISATCDDATWLTSSKAQLGARFKAQLGEIEIVIVYNMYRMRRFTTSAVCAGCCLWAIPTMPHKKLKSQC